MNQNLRTNNETERDGNNVFLNRNSIYLHLHKLLRSNQTLLPCPWTFAVLRRCRRQFQGPEMVYDTCLNVISEMLCFFRTVQLYYLSNNHGMFLTFQQLSFFFTLVKLIESRSGEFSHILMFANRK